MAFSFSKSSDVELQRSSKDDSPLYSTQKSGDWCSNCGTWDLPIPLLHSNPLSVSQWDSAVTLCPVILRSIQWENLQNFVMRYCGILFDIVFRTVPFQCEKRISKYDILLVSNLCFYPSVYMQTQIGSNCTYHSWLFSLSCMSSVSFHANKCRVWSLFSGYMVLHFVDVNKYT